MLLTPPSADTVPDDMVPIAEVPLDARTRLRLEREGRLPVEGSDGASSRAAARLRRS